MLGPELQIIIVTAIFLGLLTAGMAVPFAIAFAVTAASWTTTSIPDSCLHWSSSSGTHAIVTGPVAGGVDDVEEEPSSSMRARMASETHTMTTATPTARNLAFTVSR